MKRVIIMIMCILMATDASAGTLMGIAIGRSSCSRRCNAQYQQGYKDGLNACKKEQGVGYGKQN